MTAYHLLSLISSSRFAFPCLTPVLPRRSRKLDFESTAVLKYKRRGDIEQRRTEEETGIHSGKGEGGGGIVFFASKGGRLESMAVRSILFYLMVDG